MKKILLILFSLSLTLFSAFFVSSCASNSNEHPHTLQYVAKTEATCSTNGNVEHYHCPTCNKNFKDEKGNKEILNVVEFATRQHEIKNGVCSVCSKPASKYLTYSEMPDGTCSVSMDTFNETELIISDVYNGKPVTTIYADGFSNSSSLTCIIIPDSVTYIDGTFVYCLNLTDIIVSKNNKIYCSIDGNLYTKDTRTLIQYSCGKPDNTFNIPDSVTSIEPNALFFCSNLTNIIVGDNNTSFCSIDGNLYTKNKHTLIQYAIGKTEKTFIIPDSVTLIKELALFLSKNLT
ncbi:MAG TPA: hypothetical protein DDY82_00550, partial [Clostridiales bacterium]|nr:hypothetical protein [Clostridiales bacterium]